MEEKTEKEKEEKGISINPVKSRWERAPRIRVI